jgi:transposase InsO family protein
MKIMPNSTQEEKLRWISPILEKRMKIKDLALACPFSERAIKYWLKQYRESGLSGLENRSTRPKSQPNETPIRIKERVLELRKEMNDECALKLKWDLADEGVKLHERTIGKILKTEGLTRKYRTRKQYPEKKKVELNPGELIEIDVKYVPDKINGMRYYQFTAIDCASRWRFLKIYDQQTNIDALDFLGEVFKRFPYRIKAIKTDNGSIFTNRYVGYLKSADPMNPRLHPFDLKCQRLGAIHYLIDPGKPAQNGHVERSHRSDQESFYEKVSIKTAEELRYQAKLWNMYYNDLKHCGLNGLTPNQVLRLKVQNVRT